jgi:hypothetical protein
VRKCGRFTHGGAVAIERRGERASYSGLQTCGSVWACPSCSARVLAERTDDLIEAVESHHAAGGQTAMVTLTMRHERGQALEELWDALSAAWTAARGGNGSARREMQRAGVEHWVRRVECTVGDHGWHVHVHALLFLGGDVDQADVDRLGGAMFDAWSSALVRKGLAAPLRDQGGLDARLLDLSQARAEAAAYLAKGTYDGPPEDVRAAALELTSSGAKRARRGNRSTMQLLADVVTYGLAGDHALWREWEQASRGRRAITWSQGARDALLGGAVERSDEEIAADTDHLGEAVATLPGDLWAAVVERPGLPARLLDLAESVPPSEVLALLTAVCRREGLPPPQPPPEGLP